MPKPKIKVQLSIRPETDEYLDALAAETGRPRSWIVDALVDFHAQMRAKQSMQQPLPDPAERIINVA